MLRLSSLAHFPKLSAPQLLRPVRVFPRVPFRALSDKPKNIPNKIKKDEGPKIRYLVYVFCFSTALLVLATRRVDKRTPPQKSFTEREYQEYEIESGIKRRTKLITGAKADQYRIYVVPYAHSNESVEKVAAKLPKDKEVKIIDPEELITQELEDTSRRYSFLIQDLKAAGKPFPRGLITAMIREELQFFMNTSKGARDTNILIKNYPQTTDEAIKFENDIGDITTCLVLSYDIDNELANAKRPDQVRLIKNVVGYFDTVGKNHTIAFKHDEMDDLLQEIVLEDI